MSPRTLLATLLVLDAACWALLAWGIAQGHFHVPALAYAVMFAAMATAVPFVAAWPGQSTSPMPALCRECGAIQGPDDGRAGFCLRCGVMGPTAHRRPGTHA